MNKEEIISIFKEKPYMLDMGAKKIAKRLKCSVDLVRMARFVVRGNIRDYGTTYNPKEVSFKKPEKSMRILILDIETAPMQAYV